MKRLVLAYWKTGTRGPKGTITGLIGVPVFWVFMVLGPGFPVFVGLILALKNSNNNFIRKFIQNLNVFVSFFLFVLFFSYFPIWLVFSVW